MARHFGKFNVGKPAGFHHHLFTNLIGQQNFLFSNVLHLETGKRRVSLALSGKSGEIKWSSALFGCVCCD